MPIRRNSPIRQLEIKLKDQNSIKFYDLRGDTKLSQLTHGTYLDDNDLESPQPINLWEMLSNNSLILCIDEWRDCTGGDPDGEIMLMNIWNYSRRVNRVSHGETINPDSLKLWGEKGPNFNIPNEFPEGVGSKKKSKSKKSKSKKSKPKKSKPKKSKPKKLKSKKSKSKKKIKSRKYI